MAAIPKKSHPGNRTALTIACHIKKCYFGVVSVDILEVVSIGIEVVSIDIEVVSGDIIDVLSVASSVFALSLQATKAPIAKTNKSFFILIFCFYYEYVSIYTATRER